jgi:hypothetical protein
MSSDTSKICPTWCFGIQEDVHNAIKNIDKVVSASFCKIVPDYLTQMMIIA